MIKRVLSAGVIFLLISNNVFAELSIYTIDDKFEAIFPGNPQFAGELGEGNQKHRGYNYTDEDNLIVYTATYQVGETRYKRSDVSAALRNYVKGQALVVGGSVKTYSNKIINGNNSAVYFVKYQTQGVPVRKYGVVSYKGGHFYQWTVQDFPSISSLDGENIFNRHLVNFLVK